MPKWRRKRVQRRRRRNFWEHPDAMLYFEEFLRWRSTEKDYRVILVKDKRSHVVVGLPCVMGAWFFRKPTLRRFRDVKGFVYMIAKQLRDEIDTLNKYQEGTEVDMS